MAKFNDLQDADKIQDYVKDEFILILEEIAKDKSKLDKYLPEMKAYVAGKDSDSKLVEKFAKEFDERKAQREKVLEIVGSLKPRVGCLCNSCLDLNLSNSVIDPCLDPLIDFAKKEAESKSY